MTELAARESICSRFRGAGHRRIAGCRPKRERHGVQPQLVDQARGEILVDGARAAMDRDIAVSGNVARLRRRRLDTVGDEVERGAAVHRLRVARVVGEHEDRG